ncbi:30S ribosomal protein S17 [Candidatus Woesearchaeota archaeon]|nr:30S ribosomal protein S17 [Candidatus Woesearchaeota archaeon]
MAKKKTKKNKEKECKDDNCPIHGTLSLKKTQFKGIVTSSKSQKTATVERWRRIYIPKYERYLKQKSKIRAHNPSCIDAKEGDVVKIAACRPLSKTKKFCVVEKIVKK